MKHEFQIASPQAMEELGASFAKNALPGNIFALVGSLGAGKTHWTKGFLKALQPNTDATSPTFSIVNEYSETSPIIHHFDFYRLKSASELIDLGWDDYLDQNSIIICEWANLFPDILPADTLWLDFSYVDEETRLVKIITRKQIV